MRSRTFAAILVLTLLCVTPASTAPTGTGSDRLFVTGAIQAVDFTVVGDEIPLPGNKCLVNLVGGYTFHGSFEGTSTVSGQVRAFGPCGYPPFTFAERGDFVGTFTGTVAGRSGTFDYHYTFKLDKGERWLGTIDILSGSGELSGLRGKLDIVSSDVQSQDPYSGWISFRP